MAHRYENENLVNFAVWFENSVLIPQLSNSVGMSVLSMFEQTYDSRINKKNTQSRSSNASLLESKMRIEWTHSAQCTLHIEYLLFVHCIESSRLEKRMFEIW